MQRRSLLLLGALSPIALFSARYFRAIAAGTPLPADYRQRAEELHQLASTIQTPADARRLVDRHLRRRGQQLQNPRGPLVKRIVVTMLKGPIPVEQIGSILPRIWIDRFAARHELRADVAVLHVALGRVFDLTFPHLYGIRTSSSGMRFRDWFLW